MYRLEAPGSKRETSQKVENVKAKTLWDQIQNHQKKAVVIDVAIPSDSQQHLEEGTREAREILKAERRAGEYVKSEGSSGPRGNRRAWGSS